MIISRWRFRITLFVVLISFALVVLAIFLASHLNLGYPRIKYEVRGVSEDGNAFVYRDAVEIMRRGRATNELGAFCFAHDISYSELQYEIRMIYGYDGMKQIILTILHEDFEENWARIAMAPDYEWVHEYSIASPDFAFFAKPPTDPEEVTSIRILRDLIPSDHPAKSLELSQYSPEVYRILHSIEPPPWISPIRRGYHRHDEALQGGGYRLETESPRAWRSWEEHSGPLLDLMQQLKALGSTSVEPESAI